MWLGRGDFEPSERPDALAQACEIHNERETEYPIGTPLLVDYLEEAPDALGYSPEDHKIDRVRCLGDPAHPVRGRTLSPHSHPENAGMAVFIHVAVFIH